MIVSAVVLVMLYAVSTISCSKISRQKQAQAPKFATHNFDPLYRATRREADVSGTTSRRPNIVFILTDDQDVELGSLQFMPKLSKYLSSEGATFSHGFSSTPMCCPSRSSMLTGLYVHNHAVYTNNDNCSSPYWVQEHEPRTFAPYLQDSGYSTAYFGKYLNKYTGGHVPAGWGEWQGLVRNSRFYNYTLNVNGALHHHGFNYQKDYLPDIITNRSLNFLRWSLTTSPDTPVLATLSYPGPHGPEDSAPQYQGLFLNVTTHHTPAYDLAPNPDKQWILRETGKMAPIQRRFTDVLMTKRLQTLQSIDEGVEKVVKLLQDLNQLDNTYIFYTSDHGYHLGQYGLVKGKAFPFDVDTKVPMIVRGPGVPKNTKFSEPVVNIDLAPTFLDAAGLNPPPHMDGRSILDIFRAGGVEKTADKPWRDAFLIERGKMTFERYIKVSSMTNSTLLLKNTLTKRERIECECRAGDVIGWRYTTKLAGKDRRQRKLPPKERNDQKDFLRKHVTKADRIRARFLKEMRDDVKEYHNLEDTLQDNSGIRRWRRSSSLANDDTIELTRDQLSQRSTQSDPDSEDGSFDGMLQDVADQEILEVDGMVEDLAAEIRSLHKISNSSSDLSADILNTNDDLQTIDDDLQMEDDNNCLLNRNNVLCSAQELSSSELSWEKSRLAVRHQIQRLRAQLHELKQIRRYLHVRRPAKKHRRPRYHLRSMNNNYNQQDGGAPRDAHFGAFSEDHELTREACSCASDDMEDFEEQDEDMAVIQGASVADLMMLRQQQIRRRRQKKLEKLRRKAAKREKMERKMARKMNPKKADHCKADVKMNCFSHDNDHWKTPPLWTEGPFCACTNSNNNTYWCVRNINATHNYLYCEYVTGMVTYFDLRVDPHQLRNLLHTLADHEINYMHSQITYLRDYSAADEYRKSSAALDPHLPSKVAPVEPRNFRTPVVQPLLTSYAASADSQGKDDFLSFAAEAAAVAHSGSVSPKLDKYLRHSAQRSSDQPSKKQLKKQQQLKKRIRNLLKIGGSSVDSENAWVKSSDGSGSSAAKRLQRRLLRQQNAGNRRQELRRNRRKLKQILGED